MNAPVYLRDLKDNQQELMIDRWKAEGKTELLKAVEDGDDITVGHYLDEAEVDA